MAECNHRFVHFSGQPQRVCSECSLPYIEFVLERNRELEQQLQAQAELLEAALDFIDKHPADPDISTEQTEAWLKLCAKRKALQEKHPPPTQRDASIRSVKVQ